MPGANALRLHASERALRLCLDRTYRLAVKAKEIIGKAKTGLHRKFAHGDTAPRREVEVFPVLDDPARRRHIGVDLPSRFLLGRLRHSLKPVLSNWALLSAV